MRERSDSSLMSLFNSPPEQGSVSVGGAVRRRVTCMHANCALPVNVLSLLTLAHS